MRARDPLTDDARAIFAAAVAAAHPATLLSALPWMQYAARPLDEYRRIVVAGAGKAALAMAGAVEAQLEERVGDARIAGLVVVPHGYRSSLPLDTRVPRQIEVAEAGHPVPDEAGAGAARRTLALAERCGDGDLLLALISGGGSALWPAFVAPVALGDARETFALLLRSGADIGAMNTVRKHISRIGGGRLAAAAHPADVLALVLSDVPGDDASVIASGPTVPDPTTFADACRVLERFGLTRAVPASVREHLERGARTPELETPKPGAPELARARTVLAGSNADALAGAREEASRRGFRVLAAAEPLLGEARGAGARIVRAIAGEGVVPDDAEGVCLLWGGETTVTVRGAGRGGRNQELALAAALELERLRPAPKREIAVLSAGTDGVDGPTDAAGAVVTPGTAAAARARGLDPAAHLAANDAHPLLDAVGALVRTGPTHTNVMDVQIALVRGRAR